MTKETPEEIEAMRAKVAKADAAAAASLRADRRAALQPLIDGGLGSSEEGNAVATLTKTLRDNAQLLGSMDQNLLSAAISGAQVLDTINDRVRSLWAMAQEPAEPPAE